MSHLIGICNYQGLKQESLSWVSLLPHLKDKYNIHTNNKSHQTIVIENSFDLIKDTTNQVYPQSKQAARGPLCDFCDQDTRDLPLSRWRYKKIITFSIDSLPMHIASAVIIIFAFFPIIQRKRSPVWNKSSKVKPFN